MNCAPTTVAQARRLALGALRDAGIRLRPDEELALEVADFGLGDLARTGLQLLVYVNTLRCCAKELVLLPGQTCPEHLHPPFAGTDGKEETFRVRTGLVYLYVSGEPTPSPYCSPPRARHYSVWHEVRLTPGEQYTIAPGTRHWFQAPDEPAVISEFSSESRDDLDIFTDPDVIRMPPSGQRPLRGA